MSTGSTDSARGTKPPTPASPNVKLEEAIKLASWVHNTNANRLGYTPFELFIVKSVVLPPYGERTIVDESNYENEDVKKVLLNKAKACLAYKTELFTTKIEECANLS